jgi:hypothetical protein
MIKLNRECKGYYSNKIDNIKIVVCQFNDLWTGVISNELETDCNKYIIYKCYSETKKGCINQLVKFIQNNN